MDELFPSAIYRPVTGGASYEQETLVYNLGDGFTWVRSDQPNNDWHCYNPTAIGAEIEARKAGFRPTAITYVKA